LNLGPGVGAGLEGNWAAVIGAGGEVGDELAAGGSPLGVAEGVLPGPWSTPVGRVAKYGTPIETPSNEAMISGRDAIDDIIGPAAPDWVIASGTA
jgi:hypothetical protein